MKKSWIVVGEEGDLTYVYVVDGQRLAAVWFLGGHVERPDAWHVTFASPRMKNLYSGTSTSSLREMQKLVEELVSS